MEAVAAVGRAASSSGWTCDEVPVADGGEGTLEALGGANRQTLVSGPLGDPVEAAWRLRSGCAVIEMARASGLALIGGAEGNDPVSASTYGTGELLSAAADAGAERVIVGVGGSATTDGGLGALRALYPPQRLRGIELIVACDVRTEFLDCVSTFAPQKGASDVQVRLLQGRMERLAQSYEEEHGVDVRPLVGGGAAGGLAGGLAAVGAELVEGFELIADEIDLFDRIEGADLVVTGEGFLDQESFDGKVVGGVADLAEAAGVPCLAVVGRVLDGMEARIEAISLVETCGEERALTATAACVEEVVEKRLCDLG